MKKLNSLMCFVGDKVSRAGIHKGFPYRIPETFKEAHNLIFFVFFSKIEWEREEHKIWIFREGEIERFMNLVKLMKNVESTSIDGIFETLWSHLFKIEGMTKCMSNTIREEIDLQNMKSWKAIGLCNWGMVWIC